MRADRALASFAGAAPPDDAGSSTHGPTRARLSQRIWSSPIIAVGQAPHTLTDVRTSGNVQVVLAGSRRMGSRAVGERRSIRLPFYYGWVNLVPAALAMTATFPGRTNGLAMI